MKIIFKRKTLGNKVIIIGWFFKRKKERDEKNGLIFFVP